VLEDCRAYKEARPEDFPRPKKKIEYRNVTVSAAVIRRGGRVLFLRRPDTGFLKGLWELPMVEGDARELEKRWAVKTLQPLPAVRHSVMNRRLRIAPFLCAFTKKKGVPAGVFASEHRWLAVSEAAALPTSSMNLKILRHVGD
jgi:A/G-specific adenine glycosylase